MNNEDFSLDVLLIIRLRAKQSQLMNDISAAMKDINSVKPFLRSHEIDEVEHKLASFQQEVTRLVTLVDKPSGLLTDKEESEIKKDEASMHTAFYRFARMTTSAEPAERRIFALLEHLERRISDKRVIVNFNRTMMIGLAAIVIAIISVVLVGSS